MLSMNSNIPTRFRSIFYGMWIGALVGGILVTVLRSIVLGGTASPDVSTAMRNTVLYVLPFVIVASVTLLPLLIRSDKLNFVGFTFAGAIAGVVISALHLLAHRTLSWFSESSAALTAYFLFSAVIVAWSVWAVSRVAELLLRRFGVVE